MEAAAGMLATVDRELGDDPQPHRIAQRVEHGGELDLRRLGVMDRI
jgi:hypothetical protein